MSEQSGTNDARTIGRGEGAKGQQRAHQGIEAGKEDLVEHQGRSRGEEEQVVPFHSGADDAGDGDFLHVGSLFKLRGRNLSVRRAGHAFSPVVCCLSTWVCLFLAVEGIAGVSCFRAMGARGAWQR
ncbi:hypothetical protein D9M70_477620 [compost metagenome]